MGLLEGKTAVITGGSKGIGRAIATKYAQEGANVAFTYLSSEEKALALEQELTSFGIKAKAYKSDASQYTAAEQLIKDVIGEFGSFDILINNAGITKDGLLMRMSEEQWDQVIEVNLKSSFNLTKAALRPLMKKRAGSIINISSIVGVRGNAGQANYAASKSGMIGFTKSVALEIGSRGVRSNAIAPGFIATEMTEKLDDKMIKEWEDGIPLKRVGQVEDVANAAVFFGSDMSSYVTGQVLLVDGGMHT